MAQCSLSPALARGGGLLTTQNPLRLPAWALHVFEQKTGVRLFNVCHKGKRDFVCRSIFHITHGVRCERGAQRAGKII